MQQTTRRQGMKRGIAVAVGGVVLLSAQASCAGALGIPLDGFLTQFQTWVVGLGLIMGLVGLVGYVGSLFDNPVMYWPGASAFLRKRACSAVAWP